MIILCRRSAEYPSAPVLSVYLVLYLLRNSALCSLRGPHKPSTVQAQPRTPTTPVSSAGAASSSSAGNSQLQKNRRLAGFGRKLRSALCDFLTIKPNQ